jgi:hypothetical protein
MIATRRCGNGYAERERWAIADARKLATATKKARANANASRLSRLQYIQFPLLW